jgi:N-carbamoyl-L-amino-acid hydrolase
MHQVLSEERLLSRLDTARTIGRDPAGGITRPFGSVAEREIRQWFMAEAEAADLVIRRDGAGNLWALYPGVQDDILAAGSHMDTVPHGGAYDGLLGVLMALEAVQTLKDNGYQPQHTLAVLVLTGEEPNAFRLSTLGSRLLTGVLHLDDIREITDDAGYSVWQALAESGATLDSTDLLPHLPLTGFVEPHIEQGTRLKEMRQPLAAVTRITGIVRHRVVITGEANHAGTTPWPQRRDAVQGFAQIMVAFKALIDRHVDQITGTVGYVRVYPNAVNIIPSSVEFIVEWRSPEPTILTAVSEEYWAEVQKLGNQWGLDTSRQVILNQSPSSMDPTVRKLLQQTIANERMEPIALDSWAGHDAAHLARSVPTGMLFIRSNGKSHCPDEDCHPQDIMLGTQVLTAFLRQWDQMALERRQPC